MTGQGKEKHLLSVLLKKSKLTGSMTTAGSIRHKTIHKVKWSLVTLKDLVQSLTIHFWNTKGVCSICCVPSGFYEVSCPHDPLTPYQLGFKNTVLELPALGICWRYYFKHFALRHPTLTYLPMPAFHRQRLVSSVVGFKGHHTDCRRHLRLRDLCPVRPVDSWRTQLAVKKQMWANLSLRGQEWPQSYLI